MIRKLRIRFIAVAMLATFLVLAVMIGAINLINYYNVRKDADTLLQVLAEGGGRFSGQQDPGTAISGQQDPGTAFPEQQDPDSIPPEQFDENRFKDGRRKDNDFPGNGRDWLLSEETPYETRYFSVTLASDGTVSCTDTGFIAAVSEEEAAALARSVFDTGKTHGFTGSYRYLKTEHDDRIMIIFLDCTRTLNSAGTFLLTSVGMALLGLAMVFVLVVLFSKPIFKPVAESYRKQKQFITDASHEIKTPLTIIDANTEVIEMLEGENEWTESIRHQVRRLTGLTNDLVTLSRMDEGIAPVMADFNLSEALEETAEGFTAPALNKAIDLKMQIQPDVTCRGDEKSIRQLISILLDNAVKYCPEKGAITVSLNHTGKHIVMRVYNTAEHVDRTLLPLLFERFYRTDASRNSSAGGYGIGLSIARAIVDTHKGKITASTKDESDLTITVTL